VLWIFCLSLLDPFLTVCSLAPHTAHAQDTKENAEFKLAVNLYTDKMYDLALEQFKQFTSNYPNTQQGIQARFYLGLVQMQLKKYEEARVTFQNFALTYQDNVQAPEAWWKVGECYVGLKNFPEAASAFERLKVFHPKSKLAPSALIKSAENFKLSRDAEHAKTVLLAVIQDYGSSDVVAQARIELGELYFGEGDYSKALVEFRRAAEAISTPSGTDVSKQPSAQVELKAEALLGIARVNGRMGRTDESVSQLKNIINTYRNTSAAVEAAIELGALQVNHGQLNDAIENLKQAYGNRRATDALKQQALIALGDTYYAAADYSNAFKSYEEFSRKFAESEEIISVWFKGGESLERAKEHKRSNEFYANIINDTNYKGDKSLAYVGSARNCVALSDYYEAIRFYRRYINVSTDRNNTAEALYRIAEIYESELKDFRKAISAYQEILTQFSTVRVRQIASAQFGLAGAYEKNREMQNALEAYRDLIEQYPCSDLYQEAKERVDRIIHFELKNSDSGLEKLASVVSDMAGGRSKGDIAFQLGEIYYNDIKDYKLAADQYSVAVKEGMEDSLRVVAYYHRAISCEMLTAGSKVSSGEAARALAEFVQVYPNTEWTDDAALRLFNLNSKGKTDEDINTLALAFLSSHPTSPQRDFVLMRLGELSSSKGLHRDAINYYNQILSPTQSGQSNKDKRSGELAGEAIYWRGCAFFGLGEMKNATADLQTYLQDFPNAHFTADAMIKLAEIARRGRDFKTALSMYQQIAEKYYYSDAAAAAEVAIGDTYFESGAYDNAIVQYQRLVQQIAADPFAPNRDTGDFIYRIAEAHGKKGDRENAKRNYQLYIASNQSGPRLHDAFYSLGELYRQEENIDMAASYFKQASKQKDGRGARDVADLFFKNGRYQEAITEYSALTEVASSDQDREYYESRIIACYYRLDNPNEARKRVSEFKSKYGKTDDYLAEFEYEYATFLYRQKQFDGALKAFESVIDDYEETKFAGWAAYWIGNVYVSVGRNQDAIVQFNKVIKSHPSSDAMPRVYLALGDIYFRAEKYEDAMNNYRKVVDNPDKAGDILAYGMNNLIETYQTMGLYDGALELTRKFIAKFPNDESIPDKRIKLGILYEKLGYYDQAVLHFQKLLEEANRDLEAEIRYYTGECYYYKGDYQQAILEFLKVPYLVTKKTKIDWTATSLYMSGQSYEKMSKYDQAIGMYQQIIDRPGIDQTFKAAAQKEINRVKALIK
jgi:TolA-binding protein